MQNWKNNNWPTDYDQSEMVVHYLSIATNKPMKISLLYVRLIDASLGSSINT